MFPTKFSSSFKFLFCLLFLEQNVSGIMVETTVQVGILTMQSQGLWGSSACNHGQPQCHSILWPCKVHGPCQKWCIILLRNKQVLHVRLSHFDALAFVPWHPFVLSIWFLNSTSGNSGTGIWNSGQCSWRPFPCHGCFEESPMMNWSQDVTWQCLAH